MDQKSITAKSMTSTLDDRVRYNRYRDKKSDPWGVISCTCKKIEFAVIHPSDMVELKTDTVGTLRFQNLFGIRFVCHKNKRYALTGDIKKWPRSVKATKDWLVCEPVMWYDLRTNGFVKARVRPDLVKGDKDGDWRSKVRRFRIVFRAYVKMELYRDLLVSLRSNTRLVSDDTQEYIDIIERIDCAAMVTYINQHVYISNKFKCDPSSMMAEFSSLYVRKREAVRIAYGALKEIPR